MQSLSELNNASNELVTYTDERLAGITLTHDVNFYYNQINISSTTVVVNPVVDIEEIIHSDTANVRYQIIIHTERTPALTGSSITFATLPSGVTQSVVGSTYTLSNITTIVQWNTIKTATWNLPANWASCPLWYLEFKIIYFDEELNQDNFYSWLEFDTRFYYISQMVFNAEVTARISTKTGSVRDFNAALTSDFTSLIRVSKNGSIEMYSNFGLSATPSSNVPFATLISNSSLTADCKYGYTSKPSNDPHANVLCRSYMDTEFNSSLLPYYKFGHPINILSAFSPEIICRWVLLSPVRPTANLSSLISTTIIPSYKYRFTSTIVDNRSALSTTAVSDHMVNISLTRTFNKNIGTNIFSTNTPYMDQNSNNIKIEFSCTSGYLTWEDITSPSQLVSSTGAYSTINSKFVDVKYYPVKDSITSTTLTFKKYLNNVLKQTISIPLNYSGTVGLIQQTVTAYTTPGAFTYSMPLDSYYYGKLSYAIVGGGGGGAGSLYFTDIGSNKNTKSGNGGWSGSLSVNTNQTINTASITNSITGIVGAGGAGSNFLESTATMVGFPTLSLFNNYGSNSYGNLQMNSIALSSSGRFVAVGQIYDALASNSQSCGFSTSTDGVTWTTPALFNGSHIGGRMTSVTVISSGPDAVTPSERFVAVGQSATSQPIWSGSTDGITWTTPALFNSYTQTGQMNSITVNSSGKFVAIGHRYSDQTPIFSTSTDGYTWSTPVVNNATSGAYLNEITVNSSGRFVAVGRNSTHNPIFMHSLDGTNWSPVTSITSPTYADLRSITVNSSGRFVAVGYFSDADGTSPWRPCYTTSTNGTTWSTINYMGDPLINDNPESITVNNEGLFVVVSGGGNYTASFNGTSWFDLTDIPGTSNLYGIAVNSDGLFVAVGRGNINPYTIVLNAGFTASYVYNVPRSLPAGTGIDSKITFSDNTSYTANGGRGSMNTLLNKISYKLNNVEQILQDNQESTLKIEESGRGLGDDYPYGTGIQWSILDPVTGQYEIGHGGDLGLADIPGSGVLTLPLSITTDLRINLINRVDAFYDYIIPGSGGYGGSYQHKTDYSAYPSGQTYILQNGGSGKAGIVIFKCHGIVSQNKNLNASFNLIAVPQ